MAYFLKIMTEIVPIVVQIMPNNLYNIDTHNKRY